MRHLHCPSCSTEISEDEPVKVRAAAHVTGDTTLRDFDDGEGVVWTPGDSYDEEIKCPKCGEWFHPDLSAGSAFNLSGGS